MTIKTPLLLVTFILKLVNSVYPGYPGKWKNEPVNKQKHK